MTGDNFMRYPKFLPEKGTIGFVAPSFGCATEPYYTAFLNAQKKFQKMGYGLDLGPNCYVAEGIGISNTPQACGKELTDYYCSVDNDILISCGGGEMMCETMNFVDFEKIKSAEPKWYMGYSDNTNFTFLLSTICDTAAVYGPCAGTFGMEPWHPAIQDAFDVLTGEKLTIKGYDLYEKEGYEWLRALDHPGSRIRFLNEDRVEDIMEVLAMFDLLITDYSSVFFDYGILKKPILFYMYDLEDYKDSIRGFYFGIDKLPGRIITEEKELPDAIRDSIDNFVYDEKYREFNETFSNREDGQASRRFVDWVFRGKKG